MLFIAKKQTYSGLPTMKTVKITNFVRQKDIFGKKFEKNLKICLKNTNQIYL